MDSALPTELTPTGLTPCRIGIRDTCVDGDHTQAKDQFCQFRGFRCKDILEPEFLHVLERLCNEGHFVSDQSEPGHREIESPQRAGRALNLALSRPNFLHLLEDITGCGALRGVEGSIVQTRPRPGDELHWHDDLDGTERRLAITINLASYPMVGGLFELRRKAGPMLMRHQHTEAGSALIFAVRPDLEHRVLPLTSGGPRRVYAGWAFGKEPA